MLTNIESQVEKVNKERGEHLQHKAALETKIKYVGLTVAARPGQSFSPCFSDIKQQLKNQPSGEDGDPDSRMETERVITERRDKKAAKGKGLRGSSKSGGRLIV